MELLQIETLEAFSAYIEKNFGDQSDVLFRGQQRDLPLLPKIARNRLTYGTLLEAEHAMLEEFRRHSTPFVRLQPLTLWDWMSLAQHHGLPTRLLDWSSNPLTSLWFVVRYPPRSNDPGVMWVLRPDDEDFASDAEKNVLPDDRDYVFAPTHVSERITAQVAWVTVHKSRELRPEFQPLEESPVFSKKLSKVIIPAHAFAHFRFWLDRYGINEGSVFPGLDGLCAYIQWKHFYYEDEGERDS